MYAEFRFLFDVGDPATGRQPPANSILWPDYPVLKECIALINNLDDEAAGNAQHGWASTHKSERVAGQPCWPSLWAEDEIIGWFYQFYNFGMPTMKEGITRAVL